MTLSTVILVSESVGRHIWQWLKISYHFAISGTFPWCTIIGLGRFLYCMQTKTSTNGGWWFCTDGGQDHATVVKPYVLFPGAMKQNISN